MHAVLYHHGVPHALKLLTLANRERVAALKLPNAAREQLTIAIEMIELQIGPVDSALRAIARQQPGCRTLTQEIYGIGPLTSVAILAELGDTRRFQNSRDAVPLLLRPGRHRLPIRSAPCRRAPVPAGTARVAVGAL
jgi:transposase